ncbi:MAG: hypothetical protein C4291_15165 [Candidatus Dadabacteria bacterium]
MKIIKRIKSNFSSFEEVKLFIQILLLITVLPVIIRLLSLPKLMYVLTPEDLRQYTNPDIEQKVIKFTDYILSRNLWIYKTTCLKRSLVLYHFLRKFGMNVQICFGVRYNEKPPYWDTQKKKLEGHAWLLYNGDIFLERDIEMTKTYKLTYCFPKISERTTQETI